MKSDFLEELFVPSNAAEEVTKKVLEGTYEPTGPQYQRLTNY
jgi:hypothetical protein